MPGNEYECIPGFFAQDIEGSLPIPAVPPRFGLIDASADRWDDLRSKIVLLNNDAADNTSYKLLFLARHGQGYHNVAEDKYGTKAWDDYWSKLGGDDELTWGPDPLLTPIGINQALSARKVWELELNHGLQLPDTLYCSPLSRALKTCQLTHEGMLKDQRVIVLEVCREENGVHTCDKRRTRSFIEKEYPDFVIEDDLTEEDELWHPDVRETKAEIAARAKITLDRIFQEDIRSQFVSITAHGGFINGVLECVGRKPYLLPTGGVLPLVIKHSPVL